jgi:hypothetical protein
VDTFVESLFDAMHDQLEKSSEKLAFVQARVSAESFVRNECALAAFNLLHSQGYRVEMERRHQHKTVDLLIYEPADPAQKNEPAYQFEIKMAWPGGLPGNAAGVKNDLVALRGRKNAWALALFFAFEEAEEGARYRPVKEVGFEDGLGLFVKELERLKAGPPQWPLQWEAHAFCMSFGGSKGKACLLAWQPTSPA